MDYKNIERDALEMMWPFNESFLNRKIRMAIIKSNEASLSGHGLEARRLYQVKLKLEKLRDEQRPDCPSIRAEIYRVLQS